MQFFDIGNVYQNGIDAEMKRLLDEKYKKVKFFYEPPEPKPEPKKVESVKPVALSIDEDGQESISERMQGNSNVFIGIAAGILIVIAAIYGFGRYNNASTSTPAVQPQPVVVDTVNRDTVNVDTTIVKNDASATVENDDTTSVSNKKSRRHGRKYRRHRRRR